MTCCALPKRGQANEKHCAQRLRKQRKMDMAALDEVVVKDGVDQDTVDAVREVGGQYKYGWATEIEMEYAP